VPRALSAVLNFDPMGPLSENFGAPQSSFLVLVGALAVVSPVRSAHRRSPCMPDHALAVGLHRQPLVPPETFHSEGAPALALDMTATPASSQATGNFF
jgi:hypothetical protein